MLDSQLLARDFDVDLASELSLPPTHVEVEEQTRQLSFSINGEGIKSVYGFSKDNWGDLNIFQGGFINYGYWKDVPFALNVPLTVNQRIASSLELYKLTAKYLNIQPDDSVLEVGSGRGIGAMYLGHTCVLNRLVGIDYTPAQVARATQQLNSAQFSNNEKINFELGDALEIPFEDRCFNKVYSVEVIQHISDVKRFAKEMRRITVPGGRIALSTYLHSEDCNSAQARKLLPLINQGLENELTASQIKEALLMVGFRWVDVHSIGEHVFPGYFKWALQVGASNKFTYNYIKAFKRKMIDYYLIVAS